MIASNCLSVYCFSLQVHHTPIGNKCKEVFAKILKFLESVPQDVSIDDSANYQANCEVQWLDTAEYPFGNPVDQQDYKSAGKCSKEACPHVLDESLDEAP